MNRMKFAVSLVILAACSSSSTTNTTIFISPEGGSEEHDAAIVDSAIGSEADGTTTMDGGTSDAAKAIQDEFADVGRYEGGAAPAEAVGQPGHGGVGDVTGTDCTSASCHRSGGAGVAFGFAGTVYRNSSLAPAGPGVEVRVNDAMGPIDRVFTDSNGNFWSLTKTAITPSCVTGARDATNSRTMQGATVAPGCNATNCHLGTLNPMLP